MARHIVEIPSPSYYDSIVHHSKMLRFSANKSRYLIGNSARRNHRLLSNVKSDGIMSVNNMTYSGR